MADRYIDADVSRADVEWLRGQARTLTAGSDSEDLVQQTLLSAVLARPPERDGIRPWLRTVLRNHRRQHQRAELRRRRREEAQVPSGGPPDLEAHAYHAALVRRLREALSDLSATDRALVCARFDEGLPPREIAARLGLEPDVVRSRLARALRRLRAEVARDDPHPTRLAALAGGLPQLARPLVTGGLMKFGTKLAIACALLVVGITASTVLVHERGEKPSPATAMSLEAARAVAAPASSERIRRWEARSSAIAKARAATEQLPDEPPPAAPADALPPDQVARAAFREAYALIADCVRDANETRGTLTVDLHLFGHPDVGVVVEEITPTTDTIGNPELVACIVEGAPAFDFGRIRGSIDENLAIDVNLERGEIATSVIESVESWSRRNPAASEEDRARMAERAENDPSSMTIRYSVQVGTDATTDVFRLERPRTGMEVPPPDSPGA